MSKQRSALKKTVIRKMKVVHLFISFLKEDKIKYLLIGTASERGHSGQHEHLIKYACTEIKLL